MERTLRVVGVLVVVGAAAALLAIALRHESATGESEALGPKLDAVVAAGAPGILALVHDGTTTIRVARGLAERETGGRMRATDRFRVGSITKTFVATVVLQLAAEGRVDLDAPVGQWLPSTVPAGITVRQLLAHRSGLADYVDDARVVSARRVQPRDLVAAARSHAPLGVPGQRYAYASTNYIVLGLLVERVTGSPLERELARRIFEPLGLERTSFEPYAAKLRIHGYRIPTYDGFPAGPPEDTAGESADWAWAAGAIVSDADDLATFFEGLLDGGLVPAELLEAMVPDQGYGLGLAAFETPCGPALGHTGNLLGYVSVAWSSPDGTRSVVIAANRFPLGPKAAAAFHRALDEAYCGNA